MPKDWSDALLVPIPKKGDLGKCDNWRGIALLDTVSKVAARRDYKLSESGVYELGNVETMTPTCL